MALSAEQITDRYVSGEYLARNSGWHQEDSAYKAGIVEKAIKNSDFNTGSIADVGCGAGAVTQLIASAFPLSKVVGFDPSSDAASLWQPGVELRQANFLESSERFDTAICLDVIEHVEDVYGFLRSLRTRASQFVFNIPLDMCVVKLVSPGIARVRTNVGHLHYFNRYTAIETLRDCGYTIVSEHLETPTLKTLPRNVPQWIAAAPRALLSAISPALSANLMGGYSLLVLARS